MIPILAFLLAAALTLLFSCHRRRRQKRLLQDQEIQQRLIQWNYEARN